MISYCTVSYYAVSVYSIIIGLYHITAGLLGARDLQDPLVVPRQPLGERAREVAHDDRSLGQRESLKIKESCF